MPVIPVTSGSKIVQVLNAEWTGLVDADPPAVRQWADRHSVLSGCRHLRHVVPQVREDPDGVLFALLSECAQGDQLAGRTVLQAMLGKLVIMARRTPMARIDDFVAAMWIRIATYPLASRPRRVAANLALDTLKAVSSDLARPPIPLLDPTTASNEPGDEVTAREIIRAGRDLGLISAATGQAMLSVYADGLSGQQTAVQLRTSADMVRYRCSDGRRRLAGHAHALLQAA